MRCEVGWFPRGTGPKESATGVVGRPSREEMTPTNKAVGARPGRCRGLWTDRTQTKYMKLLVTRPEIMTRLWRSRKNDFPVSRFPFPISCFKFPLSLYEM